MLRRWETFNKEAALPRNFQAWKEGNLQDYMKLAKADPELVSLLDGSAPAGLVADALQGSLSPIPKSPEQRQSEVRSAELQHLADNNPYKANNLTAALRLEQLDPTTAKRLRKEAGVQTPADKAAAEKAAKEQHDAAMAQNIEAGRLQQLARAQAAAAQAPQTLRY